MRKHIVLIITALVLGILLLFTISKTFMNDDGGLYTSKTYVVDINEIHKYNVDKSIILFVDNGNDSNLFIERAEEFFKQNNGISMFYVKCENTNQIKEFLDDYVGTELEIKIPYVAFIKNGNLVMSYKDVNNIDKNLDVNKKYLLDIYKTGYDIIKR